MDVGLVERVVNSLPQVQRTCASTYWDGSRSSSSIQSSDAPRPPRRSRRLRRRDRQAERVVRPRRPLRRRSTGRRRTTARLPPAAQPGPVKATTARLAGREAADLRRVLAGRRVAGQRGGDDDVAGAACVPSLRTVTRVPDEAGRARRRRRTSTPSRARGRAAGRAGGRRAVVASRLAHDGAVGVEPAERRRGSGTRPATTRRPTAWRYLKTSPARLPIAASLGVVQRAEPGDVGAQRPARRAGRGAGRGRSSPRVVCRSGSGASWRRRSRCGPRPSGSGGTRRAEQEYVGGWPPAVPCASP